MKTGLILLLILISQTASASPIENTYQCTYKIERSGKPDFVLIGNIIGPDATIGKDPVTYLTLQPPSVSNIGLDARVLITGWDYHPIHIHPRGDTVTVLASGDLTDAGGEINFVDSEGAKYNLNCVPR